jgi:hypothetical protein
VQEIALHRGSCEQRGARIKRIVLVLTAALILVAMTVVAVSAMAQRNRRRAGVVMTSALLSYIRGFWREPMLEKIGTLREALALFRCSVTIRGVVYEATKRVS